MTEIEEIKRRIKLKNQLLALTIKEIEYLRKILKECEEK